MVNPVRVAKPAPKKVVVLAKRTFTMNGLWRLALWGGTAAGTLLVAVLATHSEVGSQRAAGALSSLTGRRVALMQSDQMVAPALPNGAPSAAPGGPDGTAETRRLADAVRNLAADTGQIKSRLAAVENNISDFTGSVTRQVEEAKTAARPAPLWPDETPVSPPTAAVIAAMVSPVLPPPDGLGVGFGARAPAQPVAASPATVPAPETAKPLQLVNPGAYGVDIGSALSIQALRARWAGIRSAHPVLFDNLVPLVSLKDTSKSNGVELRLVAGPVADADAAAQLCDSLAAVHLFCKPTAYSGQLLAP